MTILFGGDYSKWDGGGDANGQPLNKTLDWAVHDWIYGYIKISEGLVIDPLFIKQFQAAEGYVYRGVYHFFRPSVDPKQSALKTIEYQIQAGDLGELPLALDLEVTDGRADTLDRSKSWLAWYEQETGVRPIIYSSFNFLINVLKADRLAQWLQNYEIWLAQYPFDNMGLATREQRIRDIVNGVYPLTFPKKFSPFLQSPILYQWTAFGLPDLVKGYYTGSGSKKAVDFNAFDGGEDVFIERFELDETIPPIDPPVEEQITYPFTGVEQTVGTLNGQKYILQKISMADREFRVTHFPATLMNILSSLLSLNLASLFSGGSLKKVLDAAQESGAQIAINGDDYVKGGPLVPTGMSYSNGVQYTPPFEARYWLNISKANVVSWGFGAPPVDVWNLTSFIRPMVVNGQLHSGLLEDKIENVEIHARSLMGVNALGQVLLLVCEGFVNPTTGVAYAGVTLPQAAQLMKDKGAIFAGEHGGGGDAGLYAGGKMLNVSSDKDAGSGWRGVVQVIEFFEKGDTMYRFEATAKGDNTSLRPDHNTDNQRFNGWKAGAIFFGNETFEAPEDLVKNGVTIQKKGDIWLKVLDVNGVVQAGDASKKTGWVSITHMGGEICTLKDNETSQPPTDPEPDPLPVIHITEHVKKTYSAPGYPEKVIEFDIEEDWSPNA